MDLYELGKYKNTVISKICSNDDICKILFGDYETEDADELISNHVFPYLFIDNIQEDTESYICVETAVPRTMGYEIKNMKLIIQVLCHKSIIRYDKTGFSGNRVDILSDMTNRALNSSKDFGIGRLMLTSVDIINTDKYYGRSLIYECPDFNILNKL